MLSLKSLIAVSFIVVAMFFPLKAHADNWEYVTSSGSEKSGNYREYFIDTDRIKILSGNKYSYWNKIDYSKDKTIKTNYEMQKWDIDCEKLEVRLRAFAEYNSSGGVLKSGSLSEYESEWEVIVPGSVGEAIGDKVCS
jgi:hypothetical protein